MTIRKTFGNLTALGLVAAAALGLAAWHWQDGRGEAAAGRYRTAAVEKGEVVKTVSANGTLNPVVLVNVGTQVSGTVRKLHADFNDRVHAGQVLLELDPALFRAQVELSRANVLNAEAVLELARANEARSRSLYERNFVSERDLDQATQALKSASAQLALAQAQLARDQTNLGYSVVRSPISGVVISRAVDVGQTVAASFQTPILFQIAQDLGKMQINSSFAEADIGLIREGQPVQFTVDAFPNRSFDATVRQVRLNATSQQNVVTYDVVVGVANPEEILKPGMTAYVNVIVARSRDAMLVPNAALRYRPRGNDVPPPAPATRDGAAGAASGVVYVLKGNRLQPVPVRTGISDSRVTEVLGGEVAPGDQVVVAELDTTESQSPGTLRLRIF